MRTIDFYENSETSVLRTLLKEYERNSERNEVLMDIARENNENCEELRKINIDYEIDIHLLRMELNKRLWEEDSLKL